jgi:predicted outer membrane repeat protein
LYAYGKSDISIKNSNFTGNSAENGGAVLARVGVHIDSQSVSFSNNTAKYDGGAINADYGARLNMKGGSLSGNFAGNNGGAIAESTRASQLEETIVQTDGTAFSANKAKRKGNDVMVDDMAKLYEVTSQTTAAAQVQVSENSQKISGAAPADTFVRKN